VTDSLLTAFEDWYLAELATVDRPARCKAALNELDHLIQIRGVAGTLALFKKHGRTPLEERLRACAVSGNPEIAKAARELMDKLSAP
jgi:hypothetical protein